MQVASPQSEIDYLGYRFHIGACAIFGDIRVFIKSFGLFWRADEVDWNPGKGAKGAFRLLGHRGVNLPGLRVADFRYQQGIYILHGNHGPYYVGLTKKQGLGKRLKDHLTDDHADMWDRSSWFGFCSVLKGKDDGGLCKLKHAPVQRVTGYDVVVPLAKLEYQICRTSTAL